MKIRCSSCGRRFEYEEQDGICPHCGAYNSVSWDVEPGGGGLSPSAPTVCDAPEWHAEAGHYDAHGTCAEEAQAAAQGYGSFTPPPAGGAGRAAALADGQKPPRQRHRLLLVSVLLFCVLLALYLILPPVVEADFDRRAAENAQVRDLAVLQAESGRAVVSPFTYKVADAALVPYAGLWPLPENSCVLRVLLSVSMSGSRPEETPPRPYLRLEDGSYQRALGSYDAQNIFPADEEAIHAFPYDVYWLETPTETADCAFYFVVPQNARAAQLCFEDFSYSAYGQQLKAVTELPITFREEGTE